MVDGNSLGLQTRTNIDAPIEIADSSDDEEVIGMQNMLINSSKCYVIGISYKNFEIAFSMILRFMLVQLKHMLWRKKLC